MKKAILITFIFVTTFAYSQTDSIYKKHRHELGADITGLIGQFFLNNSGSSPTYFPNPTYILTYRFYVKKSNIRFGVGGFYDKSSVPGYTLNGQEKTFYNTYTQFSFRIGYEFVSELSSKWQAYYGLDFRPSFSNEDNQTWFSNGGYMNSYTNKSTTWGFAPVLGFRYKINKRVSLTTESSFSYNLVESFSQRKYLSLDANTYPPIPNDPGKKSKSTKISFSQPLFLVLTVNL